MNIVEIKKVLDWASSKVEKAKGSQHSNPDNYQKCVDRHKKVLKLYDEVCEKCIEDNCKE